MTNQEFFALAQRLALCAIERGWPDTTYSVHFNGERGTEPTPSYIYVTPINQSAGEAMKQDTLYFSAYTLGDLPGALARIPTLKHVMQSKLFDSVRDIQSMAEQLQLPADFISPITLMAEQLRTNILEAPKRPQVE
jgi:hypothetical protein